MVTELTFVQDQTKEGIEWEVINARTKAVVDISGCTEIEGKVFNQDYSSLLYSGTKTGARVTFTTDGLDGKCILSTTAGDMDTVGKFRTELELTFADARVGRIHDAIVNIKEKSPAAA